MLDVTASALDEVVDSIEGTCRVVRTERGAEARVEALLLSRGSCDRCDAEIVRETKLDQRLNYEPHPDAETAAEEVELEASDLDVGWYEAGRLDLAEVLSEAIVLAVPVRRVCSDVSACEARTAALFAAQESTESLSPFAALRDLIP